MSEHTDIGIVAIGRNEGERLERCLRSVAGRVAAVVYVDSGSTDGSVELARSLGADVVELDLSIPFTAARARNEGFRRLREIAPDIRFVQFVDGDCEVACGWLETAHQALTGDDALAVVCGRRRERFPHLSIYNRLCDLEWDTAIGEARSCGGDALIRIDAFEQVQGYDASLIAGEEPEMCFRLRAHGWRIRRLDAEMTLHDAALTRFGQWWKRAVRAGHAAAEGAWRHGLSPERFNVRRVARALGWGLVLPAGSFVLAWASGGLSLLLLLAYPLQWMRVYRAERRRGRPERDARLSALFTLLDKFAQTAGAWRFARGLATGNRSGLIEYKRRQPRADGAILYVGAVVPVLSETFVYREILALRARGVPVRVASVRPPAAELGDPALADLAREQLPIYGSGPRAILKDVARELLTHPVRTIATLARGMADVTFGWEGAGRVIGAATADLSAVLFQRGKVLAQCAAGVALARRVRALGMTHIHAHMAHVPTTIAMYAAQQLGVGFSFTGHANDLFRERTLLGSKLRRARFVACISQWHRRWYRDIEFLPDARLPIVRCGVNTEQFAPAAPGEGRYPVVLSVGRLVEKKGHRVLVKAFGRLSDRDAKCMIVGDGPERAALEQEIAREALVDRVSLAGSLPNDRVRELLLEAAVFCLPCVRDAEGDMDGIPVVLMEAMASGVAVVAGDLPAIRELVRDGETGLLIPPGNVEACAAALERLLTDADERMRLAEAGRRWVQEEFSEHVNIARLIEAFQRVRAIGSTAPAARRTAEAEAAGPGESGRTAA